MQRNQIKQAMTIDVASEETMSTEGNNCRSILSWALQFALSNPQNLLVNARKNRREIIPSRKIILHDAKCKRRAW